MCIFRLERWTLHHNVMITGTTTAREVQNRSVHSSRDDWSRFPSSPSIDIRGRVVDANPIIKESYAKQLLRTKRQKPGHPDEPMREHLLHMQVLDQRAQETNLEHWLNPHCYPRCDRNYGHPV
uniref:Si:dkey-31g6.6 n=1 Tax=Oncorhynchus tshawytscha TaxID=74940 RepID=A0AAZ3PW85_ONCTS